MTEKEYWDRVDSIMRELNDKLVDLEKESGEPFTSVEANFDKRPDREAHKLVLHKLKVYIIQSSI